MDWVSEAANIAYLISAVAAIIGGGYMLARKFEKKLNVIESETKPNHGSSMRDAVDRIERAVAGLDERQDRIEKELAVLFGRFDEHTRNGAK